MTLTLGELADVEGFTLQLDVQMLIGARRVQQLLTKLNVRGLAEYRLEYQRILAVACLGKPEADVYTNDIHDDPPEGSALIRFPLLTCRSETVKGPLENSHFKPGGHRHAELLACGLNRIRDITAGDDRLLHGT